jgi:chemotaxis protein methyltransferase CheR
MVAQWFGHQRPMMPGSIATEEYEFIRKLIYDRSRINLGPDKKELVRSRLQKRLQALELKGFDDYCRLLKTERGDEEITDLLDVISTNVTEFFREWKHFEFLQKKVLPEWKSSNGSSREPFSVWSAACSSGEEPYSLAILLAEILGNAASAHSWQILATDISTRMLDLAQKAVYRSDRVKLPDPAWLRSHFQKGLGAWDGHYRVKSTICQKVSFQHLNLMEWPYPFTHKFHAIFCRNVMIYFDRRTQEQLIPRLVEHLTPGGYLFVGHSESLIGIGLTLKCVQPSVYQRV